MRTQHEQLDDTMGFLNQAHPHHPSGSRREGSKTARAEGRATAPGAAAHGSYQQGYPG